MQGLPFTSDGAIEGTRERGSFSGIGTIEEVGPPPGPNGSYLLAACRGARGAADMPQTRAFDFLLLTPLVPHLIVSDVEPGGETFHTRTCGPEIIRLLKIDVADKDLSVFGMSSIFYARSKHILSRCARERVPIVNRPSFLRRADGSGVRGSTFNLPLAAPDGRVDTILSCLDIVPFAP
ncbi:MAG: hypothetical protein HXY25_10855 [Alphaproteobacteria bacterium]|nr:hypothetical protein [Alphaproteobacteria bacterium]